MPSDPHLLVRRCGLKLKNYHTISFLCRCILWKTSHKYIIEMLKDEETRNIIKDLARQVEEAVGMQRRFERSLFHHRTLAGVRSQTDLFEPKAKTFTGQ